MIEHPLSAVGWKTESLSNEDWGGGHIKAKDGICCIEVDFLTGLLEAKISKAMKRGRDHLIVGRMTALVYLLDNLLETACCFVSFCGQPGVELLCIVGLKPSDLVG